MARDVLPELERLVQVPTLLELVVPQQEGSMAGLPGPELLV